MTRLTDAEKTSRIAALLAEKFPAPQYAPMWECAPQTGGFSCRYADLLVMHLWHSDKLELHGFEIKASKSDLKRELADPEKHQALARYCNRWTLVTWDTAVVGTLELPGHWGWWTVTPDGESFEVQRKPGKLTPEEWPREFVAAMLRRAVDQSPNADFTAAAVLRAVDQYRQQTERRHRDQVERAHQLGWLAAQGLDQMPSTWSDEGKALNARWQETWNRYALRKGIAA